MAALNAYTAPSSVRAMTVPERSPTTGDPLNWPDPDARKDHTSAADVRRSCTARICPALLSSVTPTNRVALSPRDAALYTMELSEPMSNCHFTVPFGRSAVSTPF